MFHDPMTEYPYFLSFYNVTQEDPKHGQTVIVDVTSKILDQILLLSDIYFFCLGISDLEKSQIH